MDNQWKLLHQAAQQVPVASNIPCIPHLPLELVPVAEELIQIQVRFKNNSITSGSWLFVSTTVLDYAQNHKTALHKMLYQGTADMNYGAYRLDLTNRLIYSMRYILGPGAHGWLPR